MKSRLMLCGIGLVTLFAFTVALKVSEAADGSEPGIYLLVEIDGEKLPAYSLTTKEKEGQRCKEQVLEGVVLLDSEGRFAVFVTARDICVDESGSETVGKEASFIIPG